MTLSTIKSPEEIRRLKNFKRGIDFTILIVGEEGIGKSSFINCLCQKTVIPPNMDQVNPVNASLNSDLRIEKIHVDIVEENSTPISLNLILAPGFGENIDNSLATAKIVKYLELQFDLVLKEEYKIERNQNFKDGRPHAALYFIRATSKGLRELDIEVMKELSKRCNLIPVIGKADSLTSEELVLNRRLIFSDIKRNDIKIYDFGNNDTGFEQIDELNIFENCLPFAVSGSYETKQIKGSIVHVREYPWGTFKVEDVKHNDFTLLRNVLFGSHLQELKESTSVMIYEKYRKAKLRNSVPKFANGELKIAQSPQGYEDPTIYSTEMETGKSGNELENQLKDLMNKKKLLETYTNEVKLLEEKLHIASLEG
ncbi:hypothetical protein WICMUC_005779 [Wickerhamomyces mucosus]|uniref:Septin-type G domain-containing protein n=1 Tax=Wickerhamomyces mucosus TaxID=1378264 RepID=A0A9P8P477_9ASCO|nr:hypothetical protein WICMUC_005779 [Wickerhamomyces mucosus]